MKNFFNRTQCTTIATNSEKVEFRAELVFNLWLLSHTHCLHAWRAQISSKTRVYLDIRPVQAAFISRGLRKKELPCDLHPTFSILRTSFDFETKFRRDYNACTMRWPAKRSPRRRSTTINRWYARWLIAASRSHCLANDFLSRAVVT